MINKIHDVITERINLVGRTGPVHVCEAFENDLQRRISQGEQSPGHNAGCLLQQPDTEQPKDGEEQWPARPVIDRLIEGAHRMGGGTRWKRKRPTPQNRAALQSHCMAI